MKQNFSLIICTFKRSKPLIKLLNSVKTQSIYPNEIIIVDSSPDNKTKELLSKHSYKDLYYHKVDIDNRGLTKQRNYGINLVNYKSDFICFLDDDTVLEKSYFKELISTYDTHKDAIAVGGYIINEAEWTKVDTIKNSAKFCFDGWTRSEPLRFRVRKLFGLQPDTNPGFLPSFSHGRSIGFLPPSGKTYPVEQIMGGVASYKKEIFNKIKFSNYFEGYGLYEDTDFSLRLAKMGKLYINTNARLNHYHDDSGRPNKFRYGKMVVRNGWYVWRVKYPKPGLKARFKWNATSLVLTIIRFSNMINTRHTKEAFTEGLGRLFGWLSLLLNKPKIER